jgi:methionyl-tRNA formyltransferase
MSKLRIAFFGSPSRLSLRAFEELAAHHEVIALVLARSRGLSLRRALHRFPGLHAHSEVEEAAHRRRIPVLLLDCRLPGRVAERLRRLRPDLIAIAIFPALVPPEIVDLARLGAINLHPSLLPRHRGPLPLLWTYHADDREAGLTVHHASERFDAGDIILQKVLPLPRGYPVTRLDADVAQHGAALLGTAVEKLALGRAARIAQDELAATYAPRIRHGTAMVNFGEWDVERIWHFLSGLCPRFREPLSDHRGRAVLYQSVAGFERRPPSAAPGTLEAIEHGWKLNCRGGIVLLRDHG